MTSLRLEVLPSQKIERNERREVSERGPDPVFIKRERSDKAAKFF